MATFPLGSSSTSMWAQTPPSSPLVLSLDWLGTSYYTRVSLFCPLRRVLITFLESPDISLNSCSPLNPATLPSKGTTLTHSCLASVETTFTYKIYCFPAPALEHPGYTQFIEEAHLSTALTLAKWEMPWSPLTRLQSVPTYHQALLML